MRVIAIRDADENVVNIYGYGEMVGKEACPILSGIPNPKIILENGETVWGCECWWGDAERFEEERLLGRKIVIVPLRRL